LERVVFWGEVRGEVLGREEEEEEWFC